MSINNNNVGGDVLIIDQVDLDLLDEQRKELGMILMRSAITSRLSEYEEAALTGISNMLDEWSDQRARKEN